METHKLRVKTLSMWIMLVDAGVVKRNTMTVDELASFIECDVRDLNIMTLTELVETSTAYLKRRRCKSAAVVLPSGGIRVDSDNGKIELEIFEYWRKTFDMPRTRPTVRRLSVIRARLRDGFTPQELMKAIDGLSRSDFHVKRGFTDIHYAIKDEVAIRRNMGNAGAGEMDPWQQALKGKD